ncbi:MAG: S-layer homology domain-containing protein [Clostridia bacterium]|nr:S-layer homology domain-containing protein [Clostridia bacterium]
MRKIIKSALAAAISVSIAVPAFAAAFPDLQDSKWDWANPYIQEMTDMGLINGYEDGTFRPANSVTKQEALALFARAMGSSSETNADIVELAVEKYGALLDSYSIYAKEEIAFLLYRGALKESELDTYLKGSVKDEPMKRYQAAIIITKALGDENEAKSSVLTDLEYKDALDIPIDAINYVYHVTKEGIMQGMGDGTFSPLTEVTRSQMAVMLYKTVSKMSLSFEKGKLINIDTGAKNITAKDSDGKQYFIGYNSSTIMNVEGEATQVKDVPVGVDAIFTYSGNSLVYVDVLSSIPDAEVTGIYTGYTNTSGQFKIGVYPVGGSSSDAQSYVCSSDVAILYDGSPASISTFSKEDMVTLYMSNGKVTKIEGEPKTLTISNATVEAISIEPSFRLTISHALDEYNGKTFEIGEDVTVKKNGETSSFRNIYKGDKVTLTLEYGVIKKVSATSTTKTVEGTIVQVSIAANSSITVKVNGEEKTYEIPKKATVTINGEDATLYDLRVGDTVKLKLESDAVTSITTTASSSTTKQITGVVQVINTSYGFVTVKVTDSNGNVTTETVYADSNVLVVNASGSTKAFKNVAVGQTVLVTGSVKNGAFVATVIMILSE